MSQSMVNFRMDSELKKNMEQVCREMGMSLSTAFTIFAAKVSRERRIPFEISADPFYSEQNLMRIRESAKQIQSGKTVVRTLEELESMENE
ncbi:MAG: type II toxin-antitoxin system RelB/DinJ family antitoxin [Ruminococcus sp.]|nr:type II toxin-antitoxin system RelB/DinJ family antitoxin [Ruminococcus sp.]